MGRHYHDAIALADIPKLRSMWWGKGVIASSMKRYEATILCWQLVAILTVVIGIAIITSLKQYHHASFNVLQDALFIVLAYVSHCPSTAALASRHAAAASKAALVNSWQIGLYSSSGSAQHPLPQTNPLVQHAYFDKEAYFAYGDAQKMKEALARKLGGRCFNFALPGDVSQGQSHIPSNSESDTQEGSTNSD
eukprot:1177268-Amphidinium_carterae.1